MKNMKRKPLKKKENCPLTGRILHLKKDAVGRTKYVGGPYEKDGYKFTTIVYVTKVK